MIKITSSTPWKTQTTDTQLSSDQASTTQPVATDPQTAPTTNVTPEQQDLLTRIDAAVTQIEQTEAEWDEYLTDEQKAEMDRIKATLKAEATAIEGGGYYNAATGEAGSTGPDYSQRENLATLGSGWNGGLMSSYPEDAASLTTDDGEYMGTIEIESSGDPTNPTKLGFSVDDAFEAETMGEGGTIDKIETRSQGRDLVMTVTGHDAAGNEVKKSWVIKEGTVRPEPIIINCTGLTRTSGEPGITIDASRAYRISDGSYNSYYGTVRGFYIHGTSGDDTIYGSQGDDKIVAWEGNDYLDGMAGNDTVWGDEYYDAGGSFSPDGGRDTIRGGAGDDTLYGGGNIDTRFRSDSPSAANPEATYEFENIADDTSGATPAAASFVSGTGWIANEQNDGMVVMENDGTSGGGEINIAMPEGYNMAFAEVGPDGTSLIITFVGEDADGKPKTFQLKLKDFMQSTTGFSPADVVKLNFTGSSADDIIDFHKVMGLTNQVINIDGGAGDDIVIGASNELTAMGIEREDLTESTVSGSFLSNYVNNEGTLFEDAENPSGYEAVINPTNDKEILIRNVDGFEGTPDEAIRIAAPEGYETGYIARDPNGDLIVILVNPTTKDTIVIRVDDSTGLDYNDIIVGNKTASEVDNSGDTNADWAEGFAAWPGLMPISLDDADYTLDGGAGNDLVFGPTGGTFKNAEEVIEGSFEDDSGLSNVPTTTPDAPEEDAAAESTPSE